MATIRLLLELALVLSVLIPIGCASLSGGAAGPGPAAAIPNPSFELDAKGKPAGWRTERTSGEPKFDYANTGRTGQRSIGIDADKGSDAAWAVTAGVEPWARYRLTGWIKAQNVQVGTGRGALLNVQNLQLAASPAVLGTGDWTQVELTFDTHDLDAVQINCALGGGGQATGRAWFDDLQLELLARTAAPPARITIDPAKAGPPISPFIYGQFIEHLGRCIYGGIWAEMLEDRKFFHAVGAKESPWTAVGPAGAVTMATEGAFVGAHSPQVALPGGKPAGIVQGKLALRKGKQYVGRVWLAGDPGAGPVRISLVWGRGPRDRQTIVAPALSATFTQTPLAFLAGGDTDDGQLEIVASGQGAFRLGTVSLMPADHIQGMRADTLALLQQLNAPVYRWPGGNFVSGYDWKDGLGDRDRRPPRKNPAWQGVEHNDVGLDEFLAFCRCLGTEPYIAVNSGLGDAKPAAEEVEYANGGPDTPMGRLRAQHGHREPYRVKFWSIGNEMYGSWQLGHMPLEQYTQKHNQFAQAMRAVDPSIQLIAVGAVGKWSEMMLAQCAANMNLMSEHFYCHEVPGLATHVRQIPAAVRRIAEAHRQYRREIPALTDTDIRVALDEWNYWYGAHAFGELGTRYFLKDALGIAAGLHEYARASDIYFMANYAQTVNVIGCIKTSKTAAAFETTGLVLKLYRAQFGTIPVDTQATGLLDAQAAWSADRKTLTIGIVNPTLREREVALDFAGAPGVPGSPGVKLTGTGTRYQIAGRDPQAYNDPDQPPQVAIEESALRGVTDKVTVAPCSVTLLRLAVRP